MHAGRRTSRLGSPVPASVAVAILTMALSCSRPTNPIAPDPGPSAAVLVGAGDIALCGSPGRKRPRDSSTASAERSSQPATTPIRSAAWRTIRTATRRRGAATAAGRTPHQVITTTTPRAPSVTTSISMRRPAARGLGYYVYGVGAWRVIALNSEIAVRTGSPQYQWLRNELTTTHTTCTIAIWHRPLFSSGPNRDNPDMRDIYRLLYTSMRILSSTATSTCTNALRLKMQNGRADALRGLRQFTVGTGGVPLYDVGARRANSEYIQKSWGVLKLSLTTSTTCGTSSRSRGTTRYGKRSLSLTTPVGANSRTSVRIALLMAVSCLMASEARAQGPPTESSTPAARPSIAASFLRQAATQGQQPAKKGIFRWDDPSGHPPGHRRSLVQSPHPFGCRVVRRAHRRPRRSHVRHRP